MVVSYQPHDLVGWSRNLIASDSAGGLHAPDRKCSLFLQDTLGGNGSGQADRRKAIPVRKVGTSEKRLRVTNMVEGNNDVSGRKPTSLTG